MKLVHILVVCAGISLAPAALAQKWEFGGGVGGGFYTSHDVTGTGGSAKATIQSNVAGSAWLANNNYERWGGELRYDYQMGDLQLKSGGTTVNFGAESHALHYDVVWHATPSGSRIRPFVAAGGGFKVYSGTGKEVVFQPLSNIALLSKQHEITGLISLGAGVKWNLSPRIQFRAEVHDYLTPFPKKVIVPNVGSKVSGWLQDFVPMVGLSYLF